MHVVTGDSRRPWRSIAKTSGLALAISVLVSLLPSSPAQAAESCATILTDLRTQYLSTTSQLNAAIAAHTDANGKVAAQFILPVLIAFNTQTNIANNRLQVLIAQGPQATCGATTVNSVVSLLVTDLKTIGMAVTTAGQVISPASPVPPMSVQLAAQLRILLQHMTQIYAVSNISIMPLVCTAVKADQSAVQALQVFSSVFALACADPH